MKLADDHWILRGTEETFCIPSGVPFYQSLSRSASSPFPLTKSVKTSSPMKQRPSSPPMKSKSDPGFIHNGEILWVFDSKDEEESSLIFEAKSLPSVDPKTPSYELIRARIDTFAGQYPSDCIACGTVESFEITEDYLKNEIEGELERRIAHHKYSKLSATLAKHSDIFKIEAMALPATGSGGGPDAAAALVKFRVTFVPSDKVWRVHEEGGEFSADLSWFGPNTVYIGSPEGDIIGIYEISIGPPLEQLPAMAYVFTDPISNEAVISRLTVRMTDDRGLVETEAIVEDGKMRWTEFDINPKFTGFLNVNVASNDFEQHNSRVFYSMGLLNTRQEHTQITLQRKLLPDLMNAVPSAQLISVPADQVVALPSRNGGVVQYNKTGTVTYYQVSREMWKQIRASKCELWKRMCRNTRSVVSVVLMDNDGTPCQDLHAYAMAEPSLNGEHRRIGPTIKILLNANTHKASDSNKLKHYGRKILLLGGPDGVLFDSLIVDVQPPMGSSTAKILSKTTIGRLSWTEKEIEKDREKEKPSSLITCGEPLAFEIQYSSIAEEVKELLWQLRDRRGQYFLSAEIDAQRTADDSAGPAHNLLIDAVAVSNPDSNSSFIVKIQVKMNPESPASVKYLMTNYGPKAVRLYGSAGVTGLPIFSGVVEVQPEMALRPSRSYAVYHSIHNVPLEMECIATITKMGVEGAIPMVFDGIAGIDIPSIEKPGLYNIKISAEGFDDTNMTVVQHGTTQSFIETKKISMNPTGSLHTGEIRVMLSWGSSPSELDLHCLDEKKHKKQRKEHDETHGAGAASRIFPEVMTIKLEKSTRYSFYVHHYGGIGALSTSQAWVRVLGLPTGDEIIQIPTGVCEPYEKKEGNWNLFYINEQGFNLVNTIVKKAELEKFHTVLFTR
jgi:hypothetical protein